ncbi:ABC transporter permease [Thermoflexus sp.]|uniref:ABC transporter permease n=1 Tax=Thermoflexus sp. TaxID=1969742 RepID=UPI002ADDFD7C|nr:ABC transporter permease [Thermoflexus sp.]
MNGWTLLIHKEGREAFRSRWFAITAGSFAVIALAMAAFSMRGSGYIGLPGFGRTAATLVNLSMLLASLMGLGLGTLTWAAEREGGTLAYLLSYPISRAQVFIAKAIGGAMALAAAMALGFGAAGLGIGMGGGWGGLEEIGRYTGLAAGATLLAWIAYGVGMAVGVGLRRQSTALGVTLIAWLIAVFLSDLGLMGLTWALGLSPVWLWGLALSNPLHVFRILAMVMLNGSPDLLGPAGWFAWRTYGEALGPMLFGAMLIWLAFAFLMAAFRFRMLRDSGI